MRLTVSTLRENIYAILDQILDSGESIEIERRGRTLRIEAVGVRSRLDRLVRRPDAILGDPGDLVELDWSAEWSELKPSASIPLPLSGRTRTVAGIEPSCHRAILARGINWHIELALSNIQYERSEIRPRRNHHSSGRSRGR